MGGIGTQLFHACFVFFIHVNFINHTSLKPIDAINMGLDGDWIPSKYMRNLFLFRCPSFLSIYGIGLTKGKLPPLGMLNRLNVDLTALISIIRSYCFIRVLNA